MKKFTSVFLALAMLAILVPLTVSAQTRRNSCNHRNHRNKNVSRQYRSNNANRSYRTRGYSASRQQPRRKNFYGRHRNAINIGIGTAGGAILGGIIGGKKGALIGAGVGAGSGAAYTYGINPKKKRGYRRN